MAQHINSKIQVCFPAIVTLEIEGKGMNHSKLTYDEVQQLVKMYRSDLICERAIVALADKYEYYYKDPSNWGIVLKLNTFPPTVGEYVPLEVRWIKDGTTTKHWPEDLIVIHAAMSDAAIKWTVENSS